MRPPPRMSPMSDSGSGKLVSTGIRIGTVSMQVNATIGVDPEQPRRRLGRDDLLVEQLPQVAIRLKNARPLGALHPLLELQDDALNQGRQEPPPSAPARPEAGCRARSLVLAPVAGRATNERREKAHQSCCGEAALDLSRKLLLPSADVSEESSAPRAVKRRTPSPVRGGWRCRLDLSIAVAVIDIIIVL